LSRAGNRSGRLSGYFRNRPYESLEGALVTTLRNAPAVLLPRRFDVHAHTPLLLSAVALIAGAAAAMHYASLGLTLSHWDARAHLVVSRRILDSLFPGWQQIGAVWLPLPHLLNMLPVQIDAWYRNGASAVAISVLSMGVASWALSSFILGTTQSVVASAAAVALLVGNPDVLYLQSTPMTEPLLFGTTLLAAEMTRRWISRDGAGSSSGPGLALVAACMTRYEAWPVTAALILLAGAGLLLRGVPPTRAARSCSRLALYPLGAIALFLVNSRWTIGAWFITSGFFVPSNEAAGHPLVAWRQVREGVYHLSGPALVWSAYAGAALCLIACVRSRIRSPLVLLLAMPAAGLLPMYAYYEGHPFIARYGLAMVVGYSAVAGAAIGLLWRPLRLAAAVALVAATYAQAPPFDRHAPMITEARRDCDNMAARRAVTAYLARHYDGRVIMVSMGSLAHYVQDLSELGLGVGDFLHEGNDGLWTFAAQRPSGYVGWILMEERAEGGDALSASAKREPHFLDGFARVAEGGGVALYRATP
jgi:hypothetical protein